MTGKDIGVTVAPSRSWLRRATLLRLVLLAGCFVTIEPWLPLDGAITPLPAGNYVSDANGQHRSQSVLADTVCMDENYVGTHAPNGAVVSRPPGQVSLSVASAPELID